MIAILLHFRFPYLLFSARGWCSTRFPPAVRWLFFCSADCECTAAAKRGMGYGIGCVRPCDLPSAAEAVISLAQLIIYGVICAARSIEPRRNEFAWVGETHLLSQCWCENGLENLNRERDAHYASRVEEIKQHKEPCLHQRRVSERCSA